MDSLCHLLTYDVIGNRHSPGIAYEEVALELNSEIPHALIVQRSMWQQEKPKRTLLSLLCLSRSQEAWAGSKHCPQSVQVQFSSCIKLVLGRHFYKFLADLKSRLELGFKKPWKRKPSWQEDFSGLWVFLFWGFGGCFFFFITPSLPEEAFLILLSLFLSLPISCRCHSLKNLFFYCEADFFASLFWLCCHRDWWSWTACDGWVPNSLFWHSCYK